MQPPQKKPSQALGGILGCDPMEGLLKECQLLSLGPGYFNTGSLQKAPSGITPKSADFMSFHVRLPKYFHLLTHEDLPAMPHITAPRHLCPITCTFLTLGQQQWQQAGADTHSLTDNSLICSHAFTHLLQLVGPSVCMGRSTNTAVCKTHLWVFGGSVHLHSCLIQQRPFVSAICAPGSRPWRPHKPPVYPTQPLIPECPILGFSQPVSKCGPRQLSTEPQEPRCPPVSHSPAASSPLSTSLLPFLLTSPLKPAHPGQDPAPSTLLPTSPVISLSPRF